MSPAVDAPGAKAAATLAALLLATSLVGAVPAAAQLPGDTTPAAADTTPETPAPDPLLERLRGRYAHVAVSPHAHGTLVGVVLRLSAGADRDPPGREGTAHLLARVREEQAGELLDPARATLTARVERGATVYTLLAVPDAWPETLATVDSLLFEAPVPPPRVDRQRTRLGETLRFESGSPVRTFEDEAASLLTEAGSSWAAPVRGTPASVDALTAQALEAWHRDHVRRSDAVVALAGPLAPAATTTGRKDPPVGGPGVEPGGATPRVAWRVGDRVALVQEVTSGWLAVAWPAPDTVPRTAMELLAHLLEEELDPVPPDPDRYDVEVEVLDAPGGPVLQLRATLLPEALPRWEDRVLAAVTALAREPMEPDFFRWRRRRFRTERLLAEAAPEAEADRMTRDLAAQGRARDLDRAIWSLDPSGLLAAARALGEPRILLLGPDLAGDGSR